MTEIAGPSVDMDITLTHRSFFLPWRKRQVTYRGSCTVWHDIETGQRPAVWVEAQLADMAWLQKQKARNAGEMVW